MDGEREQWRQEGVTERKGGRGNFGWDVKIKKNNKIKFMPKKENIDGYHI